MFCFIISALLIGNISAVCDFCQPSALGSLCSGEIVCPTQTQVVTVQCYMKQSFSSEPIGQLLIQGSCASIENYVQFCLENNIREIVMLDTDSPVLHCSGNLLLTNHSVTCAERELFSGRGGGCPKDNCVCHGGPRHICNNFTI